MTGMRPPKVSVVMPVYKGDEYLSEAVDSILNQTFSDFEFIIICDDPTEKTRQTLDEYRQSDSRIKVYYQEREGLVNSLNRGCSLARGEYIARMDADDVSLPERFEKQVNFLDNNPDVGIVGTDIKLIDGSGKPFLDFKPPHIPTEPRVIQWSLMFYCCLNHPTVMFRKSAYNSAGGYSVDFTHAEDYEFWLRMSPTINIANFPDKLVNLRKHGNNITNLHHDTQQKNANTADQNAISNLLQRKVSLCEVQTLRFPNDLNNRQYADTSAELLLDIYHTYCETYRLNVSEKKQIKRDAAGRLGILARNSRSNGILSSLKICGWAFCLDPKIAIKTIIITGLRMPKKVYGRLQNTKMKKHITKAK